MTTYVDVDGVSWTLTPEQHAFYCQRAYDSVDKFVQDIPMDKNRDGNPWILDFERKDLNMKVYYSQPKNSSIRRFKAVCIIPDITPQACMDFIVDTKHRLTWDRSLQVLTVLDICNDERGRVVVLRSGTKTLGPITGRDFIDAVVIRTLPNGMIIQCGTGVDESELRGLYPVTKSLVRGINQTSGSCVEAEPSVNGVRVSYIVETDLKGWFPAFVINNAIGSTMYVGYFEDLQRALKERKEKNAASAST